MERHLHDSREEKWAEEQWQRQEVLIQKCRRELDHNVGRSWQDGGLKEQ